MQDYGLVSIITPTWACAAFIAETIKSIQAQTYQNWEILIQDDCSKDNTLEVVKPYMEADKRIKYECNPQNSGAAKPETMLCVGQREGGLLFLTRMTCGVRISWRSN